MVTDKVSEVITPFAAFKDKVMGRLEDGESPEKLIHSFSRASAVIATQPNPCEDIFLLTPVQVYMAERLGVEHGESFTRVSAKKMVRQLMRAAGLGMIAQQAHISYFKVGLPGLAGLTTIPLIYGLTYSIGKTLNYLILEHQDHVHVYSGLVREYWENALKEGKEYGLSIDSEDLNKKHCPKCDELVPPSHSCHRLVNGTLCVWE